MNLPRAILLEIILNQIRFGRRFYNTSKCPSLGGGITTSCGINVVEGVGPIVRQKGLLLVSPNEAHHTPLPIQLGGIHTTEVHIIGRAVQKLAASPRQVLLEIVHPTVPLRGDDHIVNRGIRSPVITTDEDSTFLVGTPQLRMSICCLVSLCI
jgi:hypothetical protein